VPVPTTRLAPGLAVSRLVTGLWQVADLERDGTTLDPDVGAAALGAHLAAGCTTFDMADHYGSAEVIAGRFRETVAAGRDDVRLLTKWVPPPGRLGRDDVRAAVGRALDRLRAERIDLLQFHAWRYSDPAWLDALFWLAELRDEGLVAQLGLTNVDTAHLRVAVASGVPIVSNQVCCSLLDGRALVRMAPYAAAHGVGLLAYGALAGGFLSERWLGAPEPDAGSLATWSQMKYRRFIDAAGGWGAYQRLLAAADRVARRLGVSVAHVALRWVLDQPGVAAVIVGARLGRTLHADDNARVFDVPLDDAAREELDAARAALAPIPGDCGDEYRRPPFLTASGDLSHHLDAFPAPYDVARGADGRPRATSGTSWEGLAGYCRAVRVGDAIHVSGTTATHGERVLGGADPAAQAHAAIDKLAGAIESLGGRLEDVVRTRVFVRHIADWEPVARAHGERFGHVRPANTLVRAELVGDEYLVEIEADAVVGGA
jgi:aryl-alcohol dehydrogenase-like predicted oxidoreductase